MVSLKTTGFAVATALAAIAQADYIIDPKTVPKSTRATWCQDEKRTCPLICQQTEPRTTLINECDPDTLTYGCLCGNNKQPNISEYSLTLPYYLCTEWGNQCVENCKDNICAASCREDHPCGASDPTRSNATSTLDPTASATNDPNTVYSGVPGSNSDSDNGNKKGAAAALEVGRSYSLAVVFAGLFAGFAML